MRGGMPNGQVEAGGVLNVHRPRRLAGALAIVAGLAGAVAMAGCEEDGEGGKFQLTYYWAVSPEDADLTTPLVDVLNLDGMAIAQAPEDLVMQIALEGSGFLQDGTLINLACACPYPDSRFFVVDSALFPWGVDARGEALVPFSTLAVDPDAIALGTLVYLRDYDGIAVPAGTVHDGCFFAGDTGFSIAGLHIDLFAGTRANFLAVDAALNGLDRVKLSTGADAPCP